MRKDEISVSGLVKKITLFDATLFVMGSVLGSGIFMTSGHMISYIGSEKIMLLIWLFGGIFTLCGGLCMAELGLIHPRAGGPYVYLKESYGKWGGFFFGWIFFWIIECGGIAALSAGFIEHFFSLLKIKDIQLIGINTGKLGEMRLLLSQVTAIVPIILLSIVNHYGIRLGIIIQNISMIIRAGIIIVFLSYGFSLISKRGLVSLNNLDSVPVNGGIEGVFLAMLAALWTYDGWYAANCTAEEMKRPEKDLPRAIIFGIIGLTIIYFGMNIFYALALESKKIDGASRVGEIAAEVIFGQKAGPWMTAGIAMTIFGCLSSTIIYGPRVYFAMARDKIFFQGLGNLNEKTRVPSRAIAIQALWSSTLCLFGKFQSLYEYVVFSLLLFFAAIGFAVFKQEERFKKEKRISMINSNLRKEINIKKIGRFKLIIAGFFIICCLLIYMSCLIWKTKEVVLGLAIVLSGWPAYIYWKRKR